MEIIKSKSNSLIKFVNTLKQKKYRTESGLCLVEGIKILREAVKSGFSVEKIFVTEQEYYNVLKEKFDKDKIVVVSEEIIKYLSTTVTPQNVLATIKTKSYKFSMPTKNFLLLDSIQDPSNMGSILRTAVATDFTEIYLINCTDEYGEKVIRSSMGNLFRCKFMHIDYSDVDKFKELLFIADMSGTNIFNINTFKNIVGLCISNEGHGVSAEIREKVKNYFSIPMANNVESLNAAVSAGILMYHIKVNQKEILK